MCDPWHVDVATTWRRHIIVAHVRYSCGSQVPRLGPRSFFRSRGGVEVAFRPPPKESPPSLLDSSPVGCQIHSRTINDRYSDSKGTQDVSSFRVVKLLSFSGACTLLAGSIIQGGYNNWRRGTRESDQLPEDSRGSVWRNSSVYFFVCA